MLLVCAAVPPTVLLTASASDSPVARYVLVGPALLNIFAICGALAVLLVFERPRTASPLAYARQLRARFLELQSTYDADSRRRPEGKEKEDDLEVSSDP